MARCTKGDQILGDVITQLASRLNVMGLKIFPEELNSTKRNTNTNNYNESENRPLLFICNSFLSLELSVKFLESCRQSRQNLRGQRRWHCFFQAQTCRV